jgi:hypothetical protein
MKKKAALLPIVGAIIAIMTTGGFSRSITGSTVIHLSSSLTKDVQARALAAASLNFTTDCVEWMKEDAGVTIDTQNSIWRYHLTTFAQNCLKTAKIESSFAGREWKITLTLPSEQAQAALKEYNTRCQRLAFTTWASIKTMLDTKTMSGELFRLGIQAIFFSMGRMEKELDVPGIEEPGSFLVDDARKIMQEIIGKIVIRPVDYIIKGKVGTIMDKPLVLETFRDTVRIPKFDIVISLAQGRKLIYGKTDENGVLTIPQFKIPFVAKGALLYVSPDFGAAVNNVCSFSALEMGIKYPEQTLLFNVEPATFSLRYTASAASAVTIPKDFSQPDFMFRFLRDSCYFKPAQSASAADYLFDVTTQVSSYSNDSTELTTFKVENAASIQDASKNKLADKTALVLERSYETNSDYPLGLFFWEAAKKSCHMVKDLMDGR